MSRETIAIDIDDVIADTTETLRHFVNQRTGLNLSKDSYLISAPYWGYYDKVWQNHGIEDPTIFSNFHDSLRINQDDVFPVVGAKEGVQHLQKSFDLLAITSRDLTMEKATMEWMNRYFRDVFNEVVFLGHISVATESKGEVCKRLGAKWLIDDNPTHCLTAIKAGIWAVLFGKYGWQEEELPADIVRCIDWKAVDEFFDHVTS